MTVDAERLLSAWYRTRTTIADIVGARVYTELPAQPTFPALRLTLIGGQPPNDTWQPLLHRDEAVIQLDAFGGPKVQARALLDAARLETLAAIGEHVDGAVTGVAFGQVAYVPDSTFNPPKPRYTSEVTVYTRPV